MTEQEIKDSAPSGATHYYILKRYGVFYVRKRKYMFFFDHYDEWNGALEIWNGMLSHYIDRLKPL